MKKTIGYITGTCDLSHEGHFRALKAAKDRCSYLILGLTTDEVAIAQKRKPILNYKQRETIFLNCRWVDTVLPHHGEPKSEAWRKLHFDICFTCAEEYLDSNEFHELRMKCPQVEIIGIPRYISSLSEYKDSTSEQIHLLYSRILSECQVLAFGITGPILQLGNHVMKTINFALEDICNPSADNFGFFQFPILPRNYKHVDQKQEQPTFPFIAGISPGRELYVNQFFKNRPWCLYESGKFPTLPSNNNNTTTITTIKHNNVLEFAHYVEQARKRPIVSVCLVMRFGGFTLHDMAPWLSQTDLTYVIEQVFIIIEEIRSFGILHGDIHPHNILLTKELQVSITDFGWASGIMFQLCEMERSWLYERLHENFDRIHFLGSLKNDFATRGLLFQIPSC